VRLASAARRQLFGNTHRSASGRRGAANGPGAGILASRECSRALATALAVVALLCVFVAPAVAVSGTLTVRISGLPSGRAPSGLLAELGGRRRPVPARGLRIARARPGVYRATALLSGGSGGQPGISIDAAVLNALVAELPANHVGVGVLWERTIG
jgi:hypothetical protein